MMMKMSEHEEEDKDEEEEYHQEEEAKEESCKEEYQEEEEEEGWIRRIRRREGRQKQARNDTYEELQHNHDETITSNNATRYEHDTRHIFRESPHPRMSRSSKCEASPPKRLPLKRQANRLECMPTTRRAFTHWRLTGDWRPTKLTGASPPSSHFDALLFFEGGSA